MEIRRRLDEGEIVCIIGAMKMQNILRAEHEGLVKAVNAKVKLTFPSGTALFVDQIITSKAFGDFGDSGALVVTNDANASAVGIVIGGSNVGGAIVTPGYHDRPEATADLLDRGLEATVESRHATGAHQGDLHAPTVSPGG